MVLWYIWHMACVAWCGFGMVRLLAVVWCGLARYNREMEDMVRHIYYELRSMMELFRGGSGVYWHGI